MEMDARQKREPVRVHRVGTVTAGLMLVVLSMLLVLVCLGIMIAKLIQLKKHPVPFSPVEVVPERAESEEKENKPSRKALRAEARAAKAKMLEKQEGKDPDDGEDSGR